MGVKAEDYPRVMTALFRLTNIRGALVTMPHKVTTVALLDEVTPTAKIAGACNAVLRAPTARCSATSSTARASCAAWSARAGARRRARARRRAAAASGRRSRRRWRPQGVGRSDCSTRNAASAEALAGRLRAALSRRCAVRTGSNDPAGHDLVVNATPLGMKEGDPLPFDVDAHRAATFVGEVVMKQEITPLLRAARRKGCAVQVGTDMLFEMIPAYLEFFGFRPPPRTSCAPWPGSPTEAAAPPRER